MMLRRRVTVVVAVLFVCATVIALVSGGCSAPKEQARQPRGPAELTRDGAGYAVPDPLPAGEPGDVIAVGRSRVSRVLDGAVRTELLYHSTDRLGADVAVSGVVVVPKGDPPVGGWPIISWGHGTTGVADKCAPSTTENLFYNEYAQQVRSMLEAGYAVAATDYIGLGTPGAHSYSIGVDLGNAMADIVAAAHATASNLSADLSATWFAVGHSEGGQAALFASRAAKRHPELKLGATVAIAPSSHLELALPTIAAGGLPADVVYGLYLLVGLATVDPGVRIEDFVGPSGKESVDLIVRSGCLLDGLAKLRNVEVSSIFDIPADRMAELSATLAAAGNPDLEPTVGPLLVVQGETDHDIPAAITGLLIDRLQEQGVDVTERVYPGLDHDLVLGPSMCETLDWLSTHGGPKAAGCVPMPTDMS